MNFITLGEIMMRLTPPNHQTITETTSFDAVYGGAETNVAVGLAGFGVSTQVITGLPQNELGQAVLRTLRKYNVGTDNIVQADGRLGVYYLEKGFAYRPSKVVYDRANSVFSQLDTTSIDFETAFKNQQWFHFTGITPALNEQLFKVTLQAAKAAKSKGLFVSCDLNFRAALWSFETAREAMSELLPYVDLIFGYEPLSLTNEDGTDKKNGLDRLASIETLKPYLAEIHERYDIEYIAFTQRKNFTNSRNRLQDFISHRNHIEQTAQFDSDILDRVGTGDAFSTGIIYGLMENWDLRTTVQFAINNMLYKHAVHGDYHTADVETIFHITDSADIKR